MATVIRIIKYEGTEEAVRAAIAKSMPLGTRNCVGYDLTIAEHSSDLPQPFEVDNSAVQDALAMAKPWSEPTDMTKDGPFTQAMREAGKL